MGFEHARIARREIEQPATDSPVTGRGRWARSTVPLAAPSSAGPAIVPPTSGTRIRRLWQPGGGGTITESSKREKKAHLLAVSMIAHIPAGEGTIIQILEDGTEVRGKNLNAYRVDLQGLIDNETRYNIQCQFRGASYAGVLCPVTLPVGTIKAGLTQAVNANAMYEWVEPEPQTAKSKQSGKNQGKGPGKGPGKGQGGSPGGGQRVKTH